MAGEECATIPTTPAMLGARLDIVPVGANADKFLRLAKVVVAPDTDAVIDPHIFNWHYDFSSTLGTYKKKPIQLIFGATKRAPEMIHGRVCVPEYFREPPNDLRDMLLTDEGQALIEEALRTGRLEPVVDAGAGELWNIGFTGLHRRARTPTINNDGRPRLTIKYFFGFDRY